MALVTQDTFNVREVQELVNRLEEVQAAAAASLHVNRHLNLEIEQAIKRVEAAEAQCKAWEDRARWLGKQLVLARKQLAREAQGHVDEETALTKMLEEYGSHQTKASGQNGAGGVHTDGVYPTEAQQELIQKLTARGIAGGWLIDPQEVEMGAMLGQGEFGITYKGQWRGATVAVKVVRTRSAQDYTSFLREVEALAALRHPHVLPFLGACLIGPDKLWLVTEYMAGGTLAQWLHPNKYRPGARATDGGHDAQARNQAVSAVDPFGGAPPLAGVSQPALTPAQGGASSGGAAAAAAGRPKSFLERIRMACEVCQGLCALESLHPPLLHRDVKPSNIFVDGGGHARVGDFGLSRRLLPECVAELTGETGTYLYMAPEVMRHEVYDCKADVWSWGVLLVECMTNQTPYANTFMTPEQIAIGVADEQLMPQIPANVDVELQILSKEMSHAYERLLNKQNANGGQTFLGAVSRQLTDSWFSLLGRIYDTGKVQAAAAAAAPQLARTSAPLLS